MTRTPYVVRLALGRSAYEPADEASAILSATSGVRANSEQAALTDYVQQYDHKGNPFNDEANNRQEAQIRAKNEVLETVGVCKRKIKERLDFDHPVDRIKFSREEWSIMAEAENDTGSDVFLLADLMSVVAPWWLENVRRRLQAGLISTSIPFTVILVSEWRGMTSNGVKHALNYMFAGATLEFLHRIAAIYIDQWLDELFANLKGSIRRLKINSSTKTFLVRNTKHLRNLTQTLIYLYLSPLPIYGLLHRLHLPLNQPATPLSSLTQALQLPPLAALLPSHPLSPLNWAWSSGAQHLPFSNRLLHLATSPVSICLALQVINTWADKHGNFCVDYNMPDYAVPPDDKADNVPESEFLKPAVELRNWLLHQLGWSFRSLQLDEHKESDRMEGNRGAEMRSTNRTVSGDDRPSGWRATQLSYVPAEMLARRLHTLSWTIILLPLETILLRSVVRAYLHSPFAGDSAALMDCTNHSGGSVLETANKIGLCFVLQSAVDTVVWGCTYGITVCLGVTRFHWGKT